MPDPIATALASPSADTSRESPTANRMQRFGRRVAVVGAAALAQAPECAAYGLIALAPLGAGFAPYAMGLALLGAVVANLVACLVGAGRLVTGPRASLALLTAALTASLMALPGPEGARSASEVLALLAIGLLAAGILQCLFGVMRLGSVVKFTPHPVRLGLTSGVGLLLLLTATPALLGLPFGSSTATFANGLKGSAVLIALVAMAAAWAALRWRLPVPPVLAGLILATLTQALLQTLNPGISLGTNMGLPSLSAPKLADEQLSRMLLRDLQQWSVLGLLGSYALTVAVLATLDTLLGASTVDGRLRRSRSPNRELAAQGLANMAAALAGGQPTSPSIPRSLALVLPLANARWSVLWYALALLALLKAAPQVLSLLPMAAVAGILVLQGVQMLSPTLWRTPLELWKPHAAPGAQADETQRYLLTENWLVTLMVAMVTVMFGLAQAVLIGATIAIFLFMRANMRDVVRRVWTGENRRSLKMRPDALTQVLQQHGRRIAVLELEGALFFGTADALRHRLQDLLDSVDTAVLDLHQVSAIDSTAARIVLETAQDWRQRGRRLVAAEWLPGDTRRATLEAMAARDEQPALDFAPDTDTALEEAEDRLLSHLDTSDSSQLLTLTQTVIGRGLSDEQAQALLAQMSLVELPRGTVLFRAGDPGDALYVSLRGHISLRLPGNTRRLASFAPGVVMGEMAVLDHRRRSAEAVAESDVTALVLTTDDFDRIKREQPELSAVVLNNISLHLADRVRSLTSDLSAWVQRAATGQTALGAMTPARLDLSSDESE